MYIHVHIHIYPKDEYMQNKIHVYIQMYIRTYARVSTLICHTFSKAIPLQHVPHKSMAERTFQKFQNLALPLALGPQLPKVCQVLHQKARRLLLCWSRIPEVCVCISVKRGLPYGKRDLLYAQKRPIDILVYLRYAQVSKETFHRQKRPIHTSKETYL